MGMSVAGGLAEGAVVLVDTNPIIYVFEGSPLADPFLPLFADIDAGRVRALVTPITLAEVVTGPLKAGREALAERYRHALTRSGGWTFRPIDDAVAVLGARLRLRHGLKLPDAIQLAVAVHDGCDALVTHDRDFSKVDDLPIISG
jgi:predicted nucleic acid-binding protein